MRCIVPDIDWSVPVAQLDRASASGVEGRGFESRRVYHLSKIPVKNTKTACASKLARRFFIFYSLSVASHPRDFFGGLPSRCSGSLRFARVESRPKVPSFKNSCKKTKKQSSQTSLQTVFLFFTHLRLLRTRGIFYAGCRRFAPALGFASSNPVGCTIFQKIITPVATDSYSWCLFFLLAKKLSKKW